MMDVGKLFILLGTLLIIFGLIFILFEKAPFGFGKLPGDIVFKKDGFTFYFPIITSLLISLILTLILNLVFWLFRK
ncbi:DUF2905 domain-containing protein [Thermocrinis jamiesonii]|uniref:DUF2905 domain-containing protein n=1 Tax=Thermocrinis jamiesonii TaxID=1302351 RepID=UPI0004960A10|nr:DUF2905 domain-containing protein [Thermocrinis jamiesonii]